MARKIRTDFEKMNAIEIMQTFGLLPRSITEVMDLRYLTKEIRGKLDSVEVLNQEYQQRVATEGNTTAVTELRKKVVEELQGISHLIDKDLLVYSLNEGYINRTTMNINNPLDVFFADYQSDIDRFLHGKDLLLGRNISFEEGSYEVKIKTSTDSYGDKFDKRSKDKQLNENEKLFEEFSENIVIDSFIKRIIPTALYEFCRYPSLVPEIRSRVLIDREFGDFKFNSETGQNEPNYNPEEFYKYLKANSKYIDVKAFMLYAIKICFLFCFKESQTEESIDEFLKVLHLMRNTLADKKVQTIDYDFEQHIDIIQSFCKHLIVNQEIEEGSDKPKKVTLTLDGMIEEIENLSKRYVNGVLRTQDQFDNIREGVISGNNGFDSLQDITYKKFAFSKIELLKIATHDIRALDYFCQRGLLSDEDIELVNSPANLAELFLERTKSDEKREKYDIYKTLFLDLNIRGRTPEEKSDIGNAIIESNIDLLNDEKLLDLYKAGLITIDNFLDFVGRDNVEWKKLIESEVFKPVDIRRLFDEDIVTLDILEEVSNDPDFDSTKKITFFLSTFSRAGDFDREMADYFTNQFVDGVEPPVIRRRDNTDGDPRPNPDPIPEPEPEPNPGPDPANNEYYTYDPRLKYRYLSTYDPDMNPKVYDADGHISVYLPYYDLYIIEKLYDGKDANGRPRYAYGAATYFVEGHVYEQYKERLELKILKRENGKIKTKLGIDRHLLAELGRQGMVSRVMHVNWPRAIDLKIDSYNRADLGENQRITDEMRDDRREAAIDLENEKIRFER